MPGGTWVTTQANGRLQLQKARLVDIPRVTWKVVEGVWGSVVESIKRKDQLESRATERCLDVGRAGAKTG